VVFSLTDANGDAVNHAVASLTIVSVEIADDGTELYDMLLPIGYFVNDPATGGYWAECSTEGLAPGVYDLWLGLGDGTNRRLRIQLTSPDSARGNEWPTWLGAESRTPGSAWD